jgi:hypothetical protein
MEERLMPTPTRPGLWLRAKEFYTHPRVVRVYFDIDAVVTKPDPLEAAAPPRLWWFDPLREMGVLVEEDVHWVREVSEDDIPALEAHQLRERALKADTENQQLRAVIQSLVNKLAWYVREDDIQEGGDWEYVNRYWLQGKREAEELLQNVAELWSIRESEVKNARK